jgi:hypothetical protein
VSSGSKPDRHGCAAPDVVGGDDAGVAVEVEVERADPAAVDEERVESSGDLGGVVVEEDDDAVGVLALEGEAAVVELFDDEAFVAVDDVELLADRWQPGDVLVAVIVGLGVRGTRDRRTGR